jgi:heptaprenyl diphosphate synthase
LVTLFILDSQDPADAELKKLLSAPITDEAVVESTLTTLRGHKALQQARELVESYAADAVALLAPLPDGPAKSALVELSNAVITRTS